MCYLQVFFGVKSWLSNLIVCLERACGELHQGTVGNVNWQEGSTWKSSIIPTLGVFRPWVCKEDT